MHTEISREPDSTYEILGLLYACLESYSLDRETFLQEVSAEHGVDASGLYKRMAGPLRRYVETFRKHMVAVPGAELFFTGERSAFLQVIMCILMDHPDWVDGLAEVPDEALAEGILDHALEGGFSGFAPDMAETVRLLDGQKNLDPEECWKLTLILREPRTHMSILSEAVRQNRPAYRKALAAVEKSLAGQFAAFGTYDIAGLVNLHNMDLRAAPSIVSPITLLVDKKGNARVGLFVQEYLALIGEKKGTDTGLLSTLRAMSDPSKFAILQALAQRPRYNLELAELTGLTAATTSHHMNVLLTDGLVSVEKRDARVYYTLERDAVEQVLEQLRGKLLGPK